MRPILKRLDVATRERREIVEDDCTIFQVMGVRQAPT